MKTRPFLIAFLILTASVVLHERTRATSPADLRFEISYPAESSSRPLDGRLLLLIANNDKQEPRLQISEDPGTQQVFGIDVDSWKGGQAATIDAGAFGNPVRSLSSLKPGDYWVQALLHVYEKFKRFSRFLFSVWEV